ncbi:MAG TPA: hypothetical protein VN231_03710 [Allosphingosinicella sp.]|nr:hypothetical protein [Allosphingosinicella sp.]
MRLKRLALAAPILLAAAQPVDSQNVPAPPAIGYADLVDLALAAPVVAHVRVEEADALSAREAPSVPPGHRRFLIEARVLALIRGEGGLAPRVSYLVDIPLDARGRARVRERTEFLVLAQRAPGRPGELRLVAPDAQLAFAPETAERLRSILRESLGADAPPRIVGLGRAFHVPGSLPGESETQIFLQTADNRPISLSVLRRPGEQPRWSVALGEMVDEAARPPLPGTLLWYRLACTLPPALPPQSVGEATPDEARAIAADYRLVIARLGPCGRLRPRR